jgi:hypothetical protein
MPSGQLTPVSIPLNGGGVESQPVVYEQVS